MSSITICQCGKQALCSTLLFVSVVGSFFVFVCLFVFVVVVVLFNTTVCQCGKKVCLFVFCTTLLFVSVVSRFCVKHCCMSVW